MVNVRFLNAFRDFCLFSASVVSFSPPFEVFIGIRLEEIGSTLYVGIVYNAIQEVYQPVIPKMAKKSDG